MMLRWSLCLILFLALPLGAEPLPGQDSPDYQAALSLLLQEDDPAALAELHRLAEAGNVAAILTLPTALTWFTPAPDHPGRLALRRLGDEPLATVAARHSAAAALWQGGAISPLAEDQLQRALGLYDLGEVLKADALLTGWFNHMPLATPLPEGFADLPAAPWLKALILEPRLREKDAQAMIVLTYWWASGRIEGAMVKTDLGPGDPAGQALRERLWSERPATPLPPATVALMAAELLPLPAYGPVRAWCAANCPASAPACAEAFITMLGEISPATVLATPLQEVLPEAEFFATKRGERVLLEPALHHRLELARIGGFAGALTAHPAFSAAAARDACFAEGVRRALPPAD
jgi:hypothetical protein